MEETRTIRPTLDHLLRQFDTQKVAVYARVSKESEVKHHSIESQKQYLEEYIEQHPDWEFAGFYVDEGITGTTMNRPALNRLMQDARNGKIDIILTKAVSRLGRNTSAVLKLLHELKRLGVAVIFDNENVSTRDPEGMFYLQTLCIMAEAEARQNSEYQKWAIRNRFKEGIPNSARPYGYEMIDHQLIVIPEEAEVVKKIFSMYLSGMGILAICKELNKGGIKTLNGLKWRDTTIYRILHNEAYVGDLLLQKTYVSDYLSKERKRNEGDLPKYLVVDCHEAIIDRETFDKVQAELVRRGIVNNKKVRKKPPKKRLLSQLIYCEHCDKALYYKLISGRETWVCKKHFTLGPEYCSLKPIREDILIKTTSEILLSKKLIKKDTNLTNELLHNHIQRIIAKDNQELEYHLSSGEVIIRTWQYESRKKSWTPEMKKKAREKALARLSSREENADE